jgi:hypothetical protein
MAAVKGLIKTIFKDTYKASKVVKKTRAAKKASIFTEAKPVTTQITPKEIPAVTPVTVPEVAPKGIKAKFSKAINLFKSILKDIYDVRKMPKGVYSGWKEGAEIAKKNKQNIVTGVGTRAKEATKQGVLPHLPGITAFLAAWIPFPGMAESGYALGRYLRKIISKKLGLPL